MELSGIHNLQILRGFTTNKTLLSCWPDGSTADLWTFDDNTGRQQWTFKLIEVAGRHSVFNIIVERGMTSDKKYLSSAGSKVDLWSMDDNSGRQQWEVIPVPDSPTPDTYHIKVVEDGRYLTAQPDGNGITLLPGDDGSGLARWQIQDVWLTPRVEAS